jgi:hypothetical protein
MINFVFFQKTNVLLTKSYFGMVLLLILNVPDNSGQLGMAIRECAKTILPPEATDNPSLPINEIG